MPLLVSPDFTSTDLFHKIRRIEIKTSRLVNELFGGQYLSTFKGRGMEFTDVREYLPGDDVRDIHWNVTARLGHPYVKRYTEERELTVLMAVDASQSLAFGTKGRFKSELAAELVSLLAFASLKNNDKIGLLLFSDRIESYIPPRKSRSHTSRLVRDVLGFRPKGRGTNIDQALYYLNQVQKKRAIVFLISDFLDKDYETHLGLTQRRHDTVAFLIRDPMEQTLPKLGHIVVEDAETGERQWINLKSILFSQRYLVQTANHNAALNRLFAKFNMDHVFFQTNQDYVKPLVHFFQERARRIKR